MKQIPRKDLIKILKHDNGAELISPAVMEVIFSIYGDEWGRNHNGEWVKLTHSDARKTFLEKFQKRKKDKRKKYDRKY